VRALVLGILLAMPIGGLPARVAPFVTFRRGTTDELSEGDHITTVVSSASVRFLVSLGPRTRAARDPLAAHMLMHELGHAVDNGLIDDELRASFGVLFSRSPAWASCFPQPLGSSQRCVPGAEIFAEQFGFYGSRDRRPRTAYAIPPLYRFRRFGALVERTTGGKDTLLGSTPRRSGADWTGAGGAETIERWRHGSKSRSTTANSSTVSSARLRTGPRLRASAIASTTAPATTRR
jgi:hypothetical protein